MCRPAAGECDAQETCTGESKDCPDDELDTSGRICRAATNPCELDAICGGQAADCLPNPPKTQGTPCRPKSGDCDVADVCNGTSYDCPDQLMPPSQACRLAAGECDVTEFCTGTSGECPADQLAPPSVCRMPQQPCDREAFCTGTDPECPANRRMPAGTVCRAKRGPCDIEDVCSGTSSLCPDALEPQGKVCIPKGGACDVEDVCTGAGPECPDVRVVGVCRPGGGFGAECDPPESCSPTRSTVLPTCGCPRERCVDPRPRGRNVRQTRSAAPVGRLQGDVRRHADRRSVYEQHGMLERHAVPLHRLRGDPRLCERADQGGRTLRRQSGHVRVRNVHDAREDVRPNLRRRRLLHQRRPQPALLRRRPLAPVQSRVLRRLRARPFRPRGNLSRVL